MKKIILILKKIFKNTEKQGTLPNSFTIASIKIPKPDKDILKENYRPVSLINTDAKILKKKKQSKQYIK